MIKKIEWYCVHSDDFYEFRAELTITTGQHTDTVRVRRFIPLVNTIASKESKISAGWETIRLMSLQLGCVV